MIVFRGREIVHPETGQAVLDEVSKEGADVSVIEQKPLMEGRRMVMILGPRTGVIRPVGPPPGPLAGPGPRQGTAQASPATAPATSSPATSGSAADSTSPKV